MRIIARGAQAAPRVRSDGAYAPPARSVRLVEAWRREQGVHTLRRQSAASSFKPDIMNGRNTQMYRLLTALALLAFPLAASAEQSDIKVEKAWSRAAMAGHTGAVYLTVTNTGAAADRLTAASTPVAQTAQVHESYSEKGIMKMRPVAALPVAPGKPVTLSPGGYHVMLMGLKQPLIKGESFPLTLTFEHAPPVIVHVQIESTGAGQPGPRGGSGHDMDMPMPMK
jgi:periplasmic copper chaperone A